MMQGGTIGYGLLLLASVLLTACGGGDKNNSGIPEKPSPNYKITGQAFIGNVNTSTIKLYSYESPIRGEIITNSLTDTSGNFTLTTNTKSKYLLVCMTGGEYTESFSGSVISLSETDELCSIFINKLGQDSKVLINYFSHLAYGLSKFLHFSKDQKPIENANATISGWVGFNIIRTEQTNVTQISNNSILNESLRVGFANAAVSIVADQISKLNQRPQGKEDTTIKFAIAAHNDLAHDGLLNGQGVQGAIMIGGLTMKAKYYRHDIAFNTLIFANSNQNGTAITPSQLVKSATLINDSVLPMFGDDPVVSFIIDRPVIQSASVKAKDVISGIRTLTVSIDDVVGLTAIGFSISNDDPALLAGIGANNFIFNNDFKNPSFEFDSTKLSDGVGYFILISAKNILGNDAVVIRITNISISNRGAKINNVTPLDSPNNPSLIRGSKLHMRATVIDSVVGVQYVSLSIDGGDAIASETIDYENPHFIVDTTTIVPDGLHDFKIVAINNVGISTSRRVTYLIDNTPPLVGFVNNPDPNKTLYWNVGTYPIVGFSSDANGVKSTMVSLTNDISKMLAGNLPNNNILLDYVISKTSVQGDRTLLIQSIDNANGISNSTRKVVVDYTPPIVVNHKVQFISPYLWKGGSINGNWVGGAKDSQGRSIILSFNGLLDDIHSGVKSSQLAIDGIDIGQPQPIMTDLKSGGFVDEIRPSDYSESSHVFKITVTDKAGNKNSVFHTALNFDNTNPYINIPVQSFTYVKPAICAFSITTTDSGGSGIATITIGGAVYPVKSGKWFFGIPNIKTGLTSPYFYEITDVAGNTVKKKIQLSSTCDTAGNCSCGTSYPANSNGSWLNPL